MKIRLKKATKLWEKISPPKTLTIYQKLRQPPVLIGISTVTAGGSILAYNIYSVRSAFTNMIPHGVLDLEKKGPSYIYVAHPSPLIDEVPREAVLLSDVPVSTQWTNIKIDLPTAWLPARYSPAFNYWDLLHRAKSSRKKKERHEAVNLLSNLNPLYDSDCVHIAQASDFKTATGLARTKNAKLNLLLKPPPIPQSKQPEIEKKFRNIIGTLPKKDVAHCVAYITKHVMERGHFYHTTETSGDWYFGAEGGIKGKGLQRVAAETMRLFYLDALLSHSTVPSHRRLIVEKGGLQLLMEVALTVPNAKVHSMIGQIIGNLALDESLHPFVYCTGWIQVLAQWLRSDDLEVNLPAARALANLDRDALRETFEDGIYLVHPIYRPPVYNSKMSADVVFVHGLTGGAFKTWRQRDDQSLPKPTKTEAEEDPESIESRRDFQKIMEDMTMITQKRFFPGQPKHSSGDENEPGFFRIMREPINVPVHTPCWPKDWLPLDCPLVRIISVDFEAEVSEWFRKCPAESEKSTIAMRSYDLQQRLLKAGIGKRPIIWVTHSMGGLLVKKLLVTSENSDDPYVNRIWKNTKGVVFFSCPHRGSLWANWGGTERVIMLTTEVQELKYNSPQLIELHEQFQKIAEKVSLPCLSFGETLKTKLGLKVEALFVTPYSSDPGFGEFVSVGTDHVNVCKPISRRSKLYLRVLGFIYENIPHSLLDALLAPSLIKWDQEMILESYMMCDAIS